MRGPDRVHEGVVEHQDEIIILQDLVLDLLGQRLTLSGLIGFEALLVFGVELVGGERSAAFELRFLPIGPAGADAGAGQEDVDARPPKPRFPGLRSIKWLACVRELKVRIQLPPARSLQTFGSSPGESL